MYPARSPRELLHLRRRPPRLPERGGKLHAPRTIGRPERGDVRLPEVFVAPGELHAAGDHAKDVIGGLTSADDGLLVVFDEGTIELKLGDEFVTDSGEKSVTRQGQLPGARLLFR